jgi:hypothetical protein
VNVEFMLCPTGAMVDIFGLFPSWILTPSYRSTLTYAVLIIGNVIAWTYIGIAKLIQTAFSLKRKAE